MFVLDADMNLSVQILFDNIQTVRDTKKEEFPGWIFFISVYSPEV